MKLPYRIVRPLARITLKTFFRKIYISGVEKLPIDKPVILAANHPSAFLEPCILATFLPRPLYFMVRGDFFQKALFRTLLMSLHMIPIYRLKDIGIKGVKNNFSSLDYTYDLLKQKKTILILAEGGTVQEKRLRPIQKGTARMALGAIEKYPDLDVHIVPVGVNYTAANQFRSVAMLELADPIIVQNFLKSNKAHHPAKIIQEITQTLKKGLEKVVIIIDKKEDEALTEALFELYRNNYPKISFPIKSETNKPLQRERAIANMVNQLAKKDKKILMAKIKKYQNNLIQNQLKDAVIVQPNIYTKFGIIGIIFGFLPYLLGYLFNFLPVFLGKFLADKWVKEIEFYASVAASSALAAYLIYFSGLLILAAKFESVFLFIFILMIPFLGFFALQYQEYVKKWRNGRQFHQVSEAIINQLKEKRKGILRMVEKFLMNTEKR